MKFERKSNAKNNSSLRARARKGDPFKRVQHVLERSGLQLRDMNDKGPDVTLLATLSIKALELHMTSGPDTFGMGTPKFDFVDCESHALGCEVFCLCRADSTNITVHIPYVCAVITRPRIVGPVVKRFYSTVPHTATWIKYASLSWESKFLVRAHHFMRLLSLRVGEIPL